MTAPHTPQGLAGAWQVWIQHPLAPGFGTFQFAPNGLFSGVQSQPMGTVSIQGQWASDGMHIQIRGMMDGFCPYFLILTIVDCGRGYFKALSHDGFGAVFQRAA